MVVSPEVQEAVIPSMQQGTIVPGNNYSGDRVPALVNSGELILNRAQTGQHCKPTPGGMQNMNLQAIVTGEQLRFILNTNSRRRGKGEYVTSTSIIMAVPQRGIRWQIKFKSQKGYDCEVNIYLEGFTGTLPQLTGGDVPVYFEEDDTDNLLKAVRN